MVYAVWTAGVLSMAQWLIILGVDDNTWRLALSGHMCHRIRVTFLIFLTPSIPIFRIPLPLLLR
jgi:hypothetical protein